MTYSTKAKILRELGFKLQEIKIDHFDSANDGNNHDDYNQLCKDEVNVILALVESSLDQVRQETTEENDEYFAYCECGDALERTGLYPKEAKYYCSGCDKTYVLKQQREALKKL